MKSRTMFFAPGRAAPGMTLAKSITDREGNTLLASGTTLTSETLDRLIRRGIETVCVLVLDPRDDETIASELLTARTRVDTIFRGTGSPAREELHMAIVNYRLESTK
ncbi:hypothetical protein [Propionivibrio sp.]|uniref:hypothetical protein n=1 Tax=Propionivibrio sp. TaxID=2212460 RepID=UPI0026291824|nr:hypothetical protein [Propionivibrio sp.]